MKKQALTCTVVLLLVPFLFLCKRRHESPDKHAYTEDNMPCDGWFYFIGELERQGGSQWFVVVPRNYTPPENINGLAIGTCTQFKCVLSAETCRAGIAYGFKRISDMADGRSVVAVDGPKYFSRAWRHLATIDPRVVFFEVNEDITSSCFEQFSIAECREILWSMVDCWELKTGEICRNGMIDTGLEDQGKPARQCVPTATSVPCR